MPLPLIIFGAGGHAKMAIEVARSGIDFQPLLCLAAQTSRSTVPETLLGVRVTAETDGEIRNGLDCTRWAFVAVGDNRLREHLSNKLTTYGYSLATLVAASACLSPSARVGAGSILMPQVVVGADAEIGSGVIVNTSATIDHDCRIDSFVHLAPGVHLAGNVHVGHRAFVGIGANVVPQKCIGAEAMVGAGAVVLSDIPARETWVGCPARRLKSRVQAA
ncbi:MAG: acetyltransferase [Aureliella sp.]